MNTKSLSILFSMLSGIFIALMARLNATLGEHIGVLESSFLVHFIGAVFAIPLIFLFFKKECPKWKKGAPIYLFGGGLLGIVIVSAANLAVPRLGVLLTMGLFLTGNFLFAVIADHFGFFNLPVFKITTRRVTGLLCAVAGLMLVL
ncbi:MAG: DMT family transporter [Deltaproteobacteria bacterium]|nr:DMT family transporter [Deltaproteobacteria bacterium]